MAKEKHVSSDRLDEWFEAMPRFVDSYRDRMLHWLASADRLCGQVASGAASYPEQAMFIVRLAGILSDLRRRFSGPFLTGAELAAADAAAQIRERQRGKVVDAIAALYALLSEDELLWLELRRHEQCHPFLDGCRPKLTDADNWNERLAAIVGKEIPIEEIIQRCAKLEESAGGFEAVIQGIAQRVFRHVGAVRLAMVPLMAGFRR